MAIIIRVVETGEVFDVPSGFMLETQLTSPIFNKLGSKTITTNIPRTENNKKILGYYNRPDMSDKPKAKIPVVVSYHSYMREGVLYPSTAFNTSGMFAITIAFNEGVIYEAMDDINLTQLSNLPVYKDDVSNLVNYMNRLLKEDGADEDLSVFRVVLKEEKYKKDGQELTATTFLNAIDVDLENSKLLIKDNTDIVYNGELKNIKVPYGYGITPFVRVWKVLDLIFGHFGYTIKSNPFREHFQLKRLCLLNNVIDAIVDNRIDYRQLVPDVSVSQFMQSLYCRFGLKYSAGDNAGEVDLYLLKDVFDSDGLQPLSLSSEIDIDPPVPAQVKLSVAKNLERSNTDTETYEEFLTKYNNTIGRYSAFQANTAMGISYSPKTGLYYQISIQKNIKLLSSNNFDWNKKVEGLETEEITSIDEALTMYPERNATPYYAVSPLLANSVLTINNNDYNSLMSGENKLAYVYDMGEAYDMDRGYKSYWGYKFGSVFPYSAKYDEQNITYQEDRNGNVFRLSLMLIGEDGAFNRFFKYYDAFLRHSNRLTKFEIDEPLHQLASINTQEKVYAGNQPYLIDKMNYNIGSGNIVKSVIEARSTRLYTPYDLDSEQNLPVPEQARYKWILQEDFGEAIDNRLAELIAYWSRQTSHPSYPGSTYRFERMQIESWEEITGPSMDDYWFLPPTEYDITKPLGIFYYKVVFAHLFYLGERPWVDKFQENVPYRGWLLSTYI